MKKNMGSVDKIIRLLLAALFIILFVFNVVSGIFGYILLALAAIFIVTSLISFCPLYTIFGIKTTPAKK
ncbi:MAG: DUF2892 domain-containing protein [Bacteroidales bacterium]|nr:DUF2892 domain-containing protein [Bacteroidales bacterium]